MTGGYERRIGRRWSRLEHPRRIRYEHYLFGVMTANLLAIIGAIVRPWEWWN